MKNLPLPEFAQNILEKFADVELFDRKKSKGFHFLASLKNNPQAKFAVIIQKRKKLDYISDFEAVKSLSISREDIEKANLELKENYYLKYPLFIWLCDTANQVIYYYHLSYSCLGEWSENRPETFHFYFSNKNKITQNFPNTFVQEVALTTLDNRKYAQPINDYSKVFPVLFAGYDEIETILEHFRMNHCLPELILEKYPKTEDLPSKLVDGLLQIFINHSSHNVQEIILGLFLHYDIRSIIPHILKVIERRFARDTHRDFHGYGHHLEKEISDWEIDPFLEAIALFNAKESWIYAQLRHLLSYNHSRIREKIAPVAFLLDFREAYADFASGILELNSLGDDFSVFNFYEFDADLIHRKLSIILQETNNIKVKIELLKCLGSNINTYQAIVGLFQSIDNELNTIGEQLIKKYFDYEGYGNSEAENEIITQAYEKAIEMSKDDFLKQKNRADNQEFEQFSQTKHEDFWEAYQNQNLQKLKENYGFVSLELGENQRFIEVFKDACKKTEYPEFYSFIIRSLLRSWIFLNPRIQLERQSKDKKKRKIREIFYDLSPIYKIVSEQLINPQPLPKLCIRDFLSFANTYGLIVNDNTIIQHYQNGLLDLHDLCNYLPKEKVNSFIEIELNKDWEVNNFLNFFKLLVYHNLVDKFTQSIENQCIKLLHNPHNFYHLPFLKFVLTVAPSKVVDLIWEVCQKHTWDIATYRGEHQYDYLQYHLNILVKGNHPKAKEFLFELLKRENIESDYDNNTYQKHIYELILANFGEEEEKVLIDRVAQSRDIFSRRNLKEILEIDFYYPCKFTG
jgi:hypothetical protein